MKSAIGRPKTGSTSFLSAKRSNVEDAPSIGNPDFFMAGDLSLEKA